MAVAKKKKPGKKKNFLPSPSPLSATTFSMAKRITQATFDAVVAENMTEFSMERAEAVEDAVKQFESQGVDLGNIVVSMSGGGEGEPLSEQEQLVSKLKALQAADSPGSEPHPALGELHSLMVGDKTLRTLAAGQDAFPILMQLLRQQQGDQQHCAAVLAVLAVLLEGQPDLVIPPPAFMTGAAGAAGAAASAAARKAAAAAAPVPGADGGAVMPEVKPNEHVDLLCGVLRRWLAQPDVVVPALQTIRQACIKHELNRQTFVAAGLPDLLSAALEQHAAHAEVVLGAAQCMRALVLDDDLRVPFGKAHEHAKQLVTEHRALQHMIACLQQHKQDAASSAQICKTVGRLAVRDEFCKQLIALNGLQLIVEMLQTHPDDPNLAQSCFYMLKAMSGNDDVKAQINSVDGLACILQSMQKHLKSPSVAEKGCAALAALSLRKPDNAAKVVELGGANIIGNIITAHNSSAAVLKQAFTAVRNVVSRSPELRDPFLKEGIEELGNRAMQQHKECAEAAKGALRDLGCKVELTEQWKGGVAKVRHE
eukprot:m.180152 g.180152  ORF g.180152 m.180152 type:complete len:539 (-) comp21458_c0_seq6:28-1644(-)